LSEKRLKQKQKNKKTKKRNNLKMTIKTKLGEICIGKNIPCVKTCIKYIKPLLQIKSSVINHHFKIL
jgi:hypothetical protein